MIDVEARRAAITSLVTTHGLPAETLVLVETVADGCRAFGLVEDGRPRLAKAIRIAPTGAIRILLVQRINEKAKEDDLLVLALRKWPRELLAALAGDDAFVAHIVLHEIAHALNGPDEKAADRWAFEQMGLIHA